MSYVRDSSSMMDLLTWARRYGDERYEDSLYMRMQGESADKEELRGIS